MRQRMGAAEDAITKLIYTYAEKLDGGDFEGVAALFADATVRSNRQPAVRRGSIEVLALYRSTIKLYGGSPCTKHVTTNVIIAVDEYSGGATARSYFTVFQARPELALQPIIAGRYHDSFARAHGGDWRFTDRLIHVDLVGDLRFHLARPLNREA